MISLKKYLIGGDESPEALWRVLRLLLQAIGLHAVEEDPRDCSVFRYEMERILIALEDSKQVPDVLAQAGKAMHAMEEYNRRVSDRIRSKTSELKHMLKMFTAVVESVSHASQENIQSLRKFESQLASASEVQDIQQLKQKIAECLDSIKTESQRQEVETARSLQQMEQDLHSAKQMAATIAITDPVTGLPVRFEAEGAIGEIAAAGVPHYAGVMVIDRVLTVNQRFGRSAGDDILRETARGIQPKLWAEDRLYRWTGPAFVLLFHRPGGIDSIRKEMRQVLECRKEHHITTATREILFPIAARWTIIPPSPSPRLFLRSIDDFAASAGGPE